MSKTLEVGLMKIMKRKIDLAFQGVGALRYSGSTLSLWFCISRWSELRLSKLTKEWKLGRSHITSFG
jgi:hypothetical protein